MKRSDYTNEEWEQLQRWRNDFGDPLLNPTEEEAMSHARSMGSLDTIRGVTQMFAEGIGWDEKIEELRQDDRKLQEILEDEDYGNKAMANFIGSAALLDPLNLVPFAGLAAKATKLRHIVTYGAGIGGGFGALGYVSRDSEGLIGDYQSRAENAAIGAAAGGILGGVLGGSGHLINRMRGRRSSMDSTKVDVDTSPKVDVDTSPKVDVDTSPKVDVDIEEDLPRQARNRQDFDRLRQSRKDTQTFIDESRARAAGKRIEGPEETTLELDPTLESAPGVRLVDNQGVLVSERETYDVVGKTLLDEGDLLEPTTPITRLYRPTKSYSTKEGEWTTSTNVDHLRTQEWFIDPETGGKTEIYFDASGKRVPYISTAYDHVNPDFIPLKSELQLTEAVPQIITSPTGKLIPSIPPKRLSSREVYRVQRFFDNPDVESEWQVLKVLQRLDKDGDIVGEDKILSELFNESKGSLLSGRFSNEFSAMEYVNKIIKRKRIISLRNKTGSSDVVNDSRNAATRASKEGQDPEKAVDETILKRLSDEVEDAEKNPPSIKDPIENLYQRVAGKVLKNAIFNSWGTSFSALGGGIYGYNAADDPNASYAQKLSSAALWSLALGAGVNIAGRIPIKNGTETLGEFMSRGIINDYGLPGAYKDLRHLGLVNRNEILDDFFGTLIKISKGLSPEENRMLHSLMIGDFPTLNKLEDEFGKMSAETRSKLDILNAEKRRLIKDYGQEMVDLDLLRPEVFNKNLDTYLHTTFRKHLPEKEGESTFRSALKKFTLIGDELRPRGFKEAGAYSKYFDESGNMKSSYKEEGFEVIQDLRTPEQKMNGTGNVTVRRQWTKEERVQMGEIEDAAFGLGETGRLMAHDISMTKFFNSLADETGIDEKGLRFSLLSQEFEALDDATKALYVAVPETKIRGTSKLFSYGVLGKNKMYVQKPILNDLTHMLGLRRTQDETIQKFADGVQGLTTTWKKLKTAWIPAVHVNNTISNLALLDLAGTSLVKYLPRAAKELWTASWSPEKQSEIFRAGMINGVFDVDMVSKEFGSGLRNAFEQSFDRATAGKGNVHETALGFTGKVGEYLGALKRLTLGKAERAYQVEDQVFRMAVFMDRVDKMGGLENLSKAQIASAALEGRKWFIDYNINAPVINWMRKYSTPFISYTYRVVPLLAEAAIMRPHKVAKWSLIGFMGNQAGQKLSGGDQETERLTMREELTKDLYGIPFMPPTVVKMPFRSANGDSQYLDISRWVPGGDIYDQREQGVPGIPTPFQPSFGIWGDLYNTFAVQKDAFTGADIEGVGTDDLALVKDFARKMIPNIPIVPGSYAWERRQTANNLQQGYEIGKVEGIEGDVLLSTYEGSPYAAQYSPLEAWAYGFGIKLRPQNIEDNKNLKQFQYLQQRRLIDRMYTDANNDLTRGTLSGGYEELQEIYATADKLSLQLEAEWQAYNDLLSQASLRNYQREDRERQRVAQRTERELRVTGGLIEGEDVPYTKEDPATRINPVTGEPYVEEGLLETLQRRQEDRTLMNRGGLLSTLQKRRQGYKDGDEVQGGDPVSTEGELPDE